MHASIQLRFIASLRKMAVSLFNQFALRRLRLRCRESKPNPTLKFPVLRTARPNGYDTATMD
jgi:hypothetical protein